MLGLWIKVSFTTLLKRHRNYFVLFLCRKTFEFTWKRAEASIVFTETDFPGKNLAHISITCCYLFGGCMCLIYCWYNLHLSNQCNCDPTVYVVHICWYLLFCRMTKTWSTSLLTMMAWTASSRSDPRQIRTTRIIYSEVYSLISKPHN